MQIRYKDPRLIFEVETIPAFKGSFDGGLAIEPPEPERCEITAVIWEDSHGVTDITEFITEYCDKLLTEWEQELID